MLIANVHSSTWICAVPVSLIIDAPCACSYDFSARHWYAAPISLFLEKELTCRYFTKRDFQVAALLHLNHAMRLDCLPHLSSYFNWFHTLLQIPNGKSLPSFLDVGLLEIEMSMIV